MQEYVQREFANIFRSIFFVTIDWGGYNYCYKLQIQKLVDQDRHDEIVDFDF